MGCSSLKNVTIGNSVTSIGEYAFDGCKSLESIEIPDSVTSIDIYTFWNCSNLNSVTIGNNVTSIGYWAFNGCNSLTDVYYSGSEEDGSKISIGSRNEYLTNATIHYNYVVKIPVPVVKYIAEEKIVTVESENIPLESKVSALVFSNGVTTMQMATYSEDGINFEVGSDTESVKVFVWESFTSMRPLCEAIEVEIK